MKNILFITKSATPHSDANYNCISPLIEDLSKTHNVSVCAFSNNEPSNFEANNINYHFIGEPTSKEKVAFYYNILPKEKNNIVFKALGPLMLKSFKSVGDKNYNVVKKLIIDNGIDTVICCSAPFFINEFGAKLKQDKDLKNVKFVAFFMDPYSSYIEHLAKQKALAKNEEKVLSKFDKIFIAPELENYYRELLKNNTKIIALRNPNLNLQLNNIIDKNSVENPTIIYSGSYNETMRNFDYFYKLIHLLKNLKVFFAINGKESLQDKLENVKLANNCFDYAMNLAFSDVKQLINNENTVLLNFGNKVNNQLPSKVFEYLSTRRPIINIATIDDDTSFEFLKNYPIFLNINSKDSLENNADKINQFVKEYSDKSVDENTFKNLYGQLSKENIIKLYREELESL